MTSLPGTAEMFDLRMSEAVRPLYDAVKRFLAEEVEPNTCEFFRLGEGRKDRWSYGAGQLDFLDSIKAKAKASGISACPTQRRARIVQPGIHVYRNRTRQKSPRVGVPELSAPDSGNMEVLDAWAPLSRNAVGLSRC